MSRFARRRVLSASAVLPLALTLLAAASVFAGGGGGGPLSL